MLKRINEQVCRVRQSRAGQSRAGQGGWRKFVRLFGLVVLLLSVPGCPGGDPIESELERFPLSGVELKVLVVDDPAIAQQVQSLSGAWEDTTGGTILVLQCTGDELAVCKQLDADAVITSPHRIGMLERNGWIQELPNFTEPEYKQWGGYFPLLRDRESNWSNQPVGVPFGSPVFVLYYRTDLLKAAGCEPPKTWVEYEDVVKRLSQCMAQHPDDLVENVTLEPVGKEWCGTALLARAAPYASHHDNYSVLFDLETVRPLIDGAPFVRALQEMCQTVGLSELAKRDPSLDPSQVRDLFWAGRCAMCVTWPTAVTEGGDSLFAGDEASSDEALDTITASVQKYSGPASRVDGHVGIARLPGSTDVYDVMSDEWDTRSGRHSAHVPLLGIAGRSGYVVKGASNPKAVFDLLLKLSGDEWGTQVSSVSEETTTYRKEQLRRPGRWVEGAMPAEAAMQYIDAVEQSLEADQYVFAVRIPGRERYMQALDQEVRLALLGEVTPEAALKAVATRWQQITDELGVEQQRDEYSKSLGL